MIDTIRKLLAPLQRRIMLMVSRGVVNMVNDALGIQGVQVKLLDGETFEMERFQDYGLTSVPPDKSEHVAVFIGGNRDHGIVIKCDNRSARLKGLEKGEVALYTDEGASIKLLRNKVTEINANKVFIGNETIELLDQIVQLLTALMNSVVPTISGPQKLSEVVGNFPIIKAKLELLKK